MRNFLKMIENGGFGDLFQRKDKLTKEEEIAVRTSQPTRGKWNTTNIRKTLMRAGTLLYTGGNTGGTVNQRKRERRAYRKQFTRRQWNEMKEAIRREDRREAQKAAR